MPYKSFRVSYQKSGQSYACQEAGLLGMFSSKASETEWLAASYKVILTQEHTSEDYETFHETMCGVWHPED